MRAKSYSLPGHAGKQARTPVSNFMLKVLLKLQVTKDRRDTGVAAEHAHLLRYRGGFSLCTTSETFSERKCSICFLTQWVRNNSAWENKFFPLF